MGEALTAENARGRIEKAALALLRYVEENATGFRVLTRDSHVASGTGSFAGLINDIAGQVEHVLADEFAEQGYSRALAPMYAQDRKSTRLNSSHVSISYAVFCLKKKNNLDNGVCTRSII